MSDITDNIIPFKDSEGTILKINDKVHDNKNLWTIVNSGGVTMVQRTGEGGRIEASIVIRKFDFSKSKKV